MEYAVLFLIAILVSRLASGVHINLKRFVIGVCHLYSDQQISAPRIAISRSLSRFITLAGVVAMLGGSLVKTAAEFVSEHLSDEGEC